MLNAYKNNQDLYATVAAQVFNNTYWDNMEVSQDGTPNPEGKKRRSFCKSVILGIMYQRGAASIAEQIGQTVQQAQEIIDKFYLGFPKVKIWVDETMQSAHTLGYVEDLWGRRRRLPDILLPKYTIKTKNDNIASDINNPLLYAKEVFKPKESSTVAKYEQQLEKCRNRRDYELIKAAALKEGITITDNSGFIAQAERQSVNARVQGGAASMSKRAMILVHNDPELSRMGFRLMLAVHDELIGECPEQYAEEVADRLSYLMIESAKPDCSCPMKCDATIEERWYITDYGDKLRSEFQKYLQKLNDKQAVFELLKTEYSECTEDQLYTLLSKEMAC